MAKKVLFTGIDVSNAGQGKIADWSKVAKNVDFAILKISNGYQYDKNVADSQFATNFAACQKYGVPVGVYVYAYFTSVAKTREAAQFAVKLLNGKKIDFPIFLDLEESKIRNLGKAKILELSKAFCEEVEKAGYQYGTYANKDWFANTLTDSWYDKYIKWVAQYDVSDVTYKGTLDIWQYTDKGSVPGINGKVDMNRCYTSFVKGDVNNDGKVTATDARLILRVSAKLEVLSGQAAKNADVDGDGDVDAADARDALRISAGVNG